MYNGNKIRFIMWSYVVHLLEEYGRVEITDGLEFMNDAIVWYESLDVTTTTEISRADPDKPLSLEVSLQE